jgi:hypothetical protein
LGIDVSSHPSISYPPLVVIYTRCNNQVQYFFFFWKRRSSSTCAIVHAVHNMYVVVAITCLGTCLKPHLSNPSLEQNLRHRPTAQHRHRIIHPTLVYSFHAFMVVSFSSDNDSDLGLLVGRGIGTVYYRRALPELCFVLVVAEVDDVGPLLA